MIKLFKISLYCLFLTTFFSCGESSTDIQPINVDESNFDINIQGDLIQYNEHDIEITKINFPHDLKIDYVDWSINRISQDNHRETYLKTSFKQYGDNEIKAIIHLNNNQTITLKKQITIKEKPYLSAFIVALKITGINGINEFKYRTNGGYNLISLRARFEIYNIEDNTKIFISDKDFTNNRTSNFEEIFWSSLFPPNPSLKVYEDGIPSTSFGLTLYGQNVELADAEMIILNTGVSFDEYRLIKPNTIKFTTRGVSYEILVVWQ